MTRGGWLLDEDVAADVCSWLRQRGEICERVPTIVTDPDDPIRRRDEAIAQLAHDRDMILVTHDVEFSRWRRKRLIGHHLWLRCAEPTAVEVLARVYDEVALVAAANDHVWWRASVTNLVRDFGWNA